MLESPRLSLLPYYAGPADVAAFVGVPVIEGRTARGVLVADRAGGRALRRRRAVALMSSAAEQVVRAVQSERVFQAVERSKHEHERFYNALGRAQPRAHPRRGLRRRHRRRARRLRVRLRRHRHLRRASGQPHHPPRRGRVAPRSWTAPATAIRRRSPRWWSRTSWPCPRAATGASATSPVFSHPMRINDYESLLVLPLLVKDEVIGTFTVAAKPRRRLPQRPARDAGRDRQPGRDLAAERAACTRCSRSRRPPTA